MSALSFATTFLSDFARLSPDVQLNTLDVLRAYQAGQHPDLESVAGAADPGVRVVSIAPDWSGVVVPDPDATEYDWPDHSSSQSGEPADGPNYRLLTVRPREEALRFARGLRPGSGAETVPDRVDPVPSGPPELSGALNAPFDQWRLTLHPDQYRLTESHFNGAVQITGGPGTGKTVLALHRAARLAERDAATHPTDTRESILLTTFNRALAQTLSEQLERLLPDPGTRARVRVATTDSLARSVFQAHSSVPPRLIGRDELARRWRAVALADGLPFSGRFLVDEWEQVILAQGLELLPQYIRSERSGRVQHLAPELRRQVWETIRRYVGAMRVEGLWAHPQLAAEAARLLGNEQRHLFRHVIVDEAQDLHPAQWRMLRAAVPEGPDDLFIVGDPHQRVSDNRVSLASLGINVRGRGHRMRVSYRVTQEILDWSMPILGRRSALGLDDDADALAGFRSELRGTAPVIRGCRDRTEELSALGDWVRVWLEAGVNPAEIAVAGRNQWVVRGVSKELAARNVPTTPLEGTGGGQAVRVGTLHRLKGQEFRCVALVGISDHLLPPKAAIEAADGDQVALEHAFQQERALLFMASTRARDALYVSHVGRPSRLLTEHW